MLDVAIRGGHIVDGTGRPMFKAEVGISKDRVVELGQQVSKAAVEIDASHKIVCPGFIDIHSHSELTLIIDPLANSKIRQGVTTEVIGNCGFGVAPLKEAEINQFVDFWRRSGSEWYDLEPTWKSMSEYLGTLEKRRVALNVATLAPHGAIRFYVMGDEPRKASDSEVSAMESLVEECMKCGAFGLSTGLRYKPGSYAEPDELIRLCKIVKKYQGFYATHMRSEGDNGDWEQAVLEAITIAKQSEVPLQISHLKALGTQVWNSSGRILELCESYRKQGLDLSSDQYPYDATSTGLTVLLPTWVIPSELKDLSDSKKKMLIEHFKKVLEMRGGASRIVILSSPEGKFDGKDIEQISREMKLAPEESIQKLMIDSNCQLSMISRSMIEEDIQRIMKTSFVMVASDGYSLSPTGLLGAGIPHPRSYGTFPRVLGHYVRDLLVLTLEDAVRKMTSLPARRLGLRKHGLVELDAVADLVVFDAERVQDSATFSNPDLYPAGIDFVLVNGRVVINKGEHTGKLPGKVLRKQDNN